MSLFILATCHLSVQWAQTNYDISTELITQTSLWTLRGSNDLLIWQLRTGVWGFSELAIDSSMLNMCDSLSATDSQNSVSSRISSQHQCSISWTASVPSLPYCDWLWTFRLWNTSPTVHFAYGHHKNTYPAIHTAAVSTVITLFLLYIV